MKQIQAIGSPFYTHLSSCSHLKPKLFEWTNEDRPIKVFMDGAIAPGINYSKKQGEKKIAWVCESRAIFHAWHIPENVWEQNIDYIASAYDEVYVSDRRWCNRKPNIKFNMAGSNLPWLKIPQQIPNKTKNVSMVASGKLVTEGHKYRHAIAEKFKNKLDLFGGAAGSNRIGERGNPWPDKSETILPYMFSVVIENDTYTTYFTEKVTDCFAAGTIPIYWGTPDIGNYFNTDGIIKLNDDFDISMLSKDLYYAKMDAIKDNFERVNKMLSSDDLLFQNIHEN